MLSVPDAETVDVVFAGEVPVFFSDVEAETAEVSVAGAVVPCEAAADDDDCGDVVFSAAVCSCAGASVCCGGVVSCLRLSSMSRGVFPSVMRLNATKE